MIESLAKKIPCIKNYRKISQINKGFSTDQKFLVYMSNGNDKLFLRLFALEQLESKKIEYSILKRMQDRKVNCCKPIAIGEIEEKGYMVTSYIEGNDAGDEVSSYTDQEQYNLGCEAGKELKKMHHYKAPDYIPSWYSRKFEKHEKYVEAYLSSGIKIKNDEKIIRFINDNSYLMKERPNLFQHDDFHLGNLIVKDRVFAGVIDFDRYDWGDPIHEFLKIGIFSRNISIPFSIGQIRGYFDNIDPDEDFWNLYALYMAMCVFSTVVWTLNSFPKDLNNMLERIDTFLDDHDSFDRMKPKWYIDKNEGERF
ncbi:aminoglycoside phosphotransferase family protein [Planococcus sp. SSTMD024]|uniref:aminoglycoside phosphotransferase family protein n=1 Tax=Planococcus sp. SSTMD024 TaxID=3242163 RepID=UPI00351F155D